MGRDWALLRWHANRQADVVTRVQCLDAGLSDEAIAHRLDTGRWRRLHRGVYLTARGRRDWHVTAAGAFLRCGDDAVLGGGSAAYLWGLSRTPPQVIELFVPEHRSVRPVTGAVVRRRTNLDDLADQVAFPWRTAVAVTVMDMAASAAPDAAIAVLARAVQEERVGVGELLAELDRRGRMRHGRMVREVLAEVSVGAQSPAEVRYIRDVERAHALPVADRQVATSHGARRVHDNRYAEQQVLVEVDGRVGHERWEDRVRDGRRDRVVLPDKGVTLRVFWPDVALTPCRTAVEIGAVLTTYGWTGRLRRCRRTGCVVAA